MNILLLTTILVCNTNILLLVLVSVENNANSWNCCSAKKYNRAIFLTLRYVYMADRWYNNLDWRLVLVLYHPLLC